MSLRERLTLTIITILILFSINIGTNSWSNSTRTSSIKSLQQAIEGQIAATSIKQNLQGMSQRFSIHKQQQQRSRQALNPEVIPPAITNINDLQASVQQLGLIANKVNSEQYHLLWKDTIELTQIWKNFYRQYNNIDSDFNYNDEKNKQLLTDAIQILESLKESLSSIADKQNLEINNLEIVTNRITIIVFFISIAFTIGLGVSLINYTNRELNQLKNGATIIGDGNFDYRIPIINKDELGAVAESFNIMSEKMNQAMIAVKDAKVQADLANSAKSDFLANMSHELRTPLNAIIGYSEMMLEDLQLGEINEEEQIKDLVKVLYAGRHLLSQINDVLDFSKIESGNMTLYKEQFNPNQILQEVINTITPLADQGYNQLTFNNDLKVPEINNDITKFRQIFFNLLSNACKFTHKGNITLTTKYSIDQPQNMQFIVNDTGIGMTDEQLNVVFDPFIQADTSTTRKYGGTGLGLALCKQYCQLLGATIRVQSNLNHGSMFIVDLPVDNPCP